MTQKISKAMAHLTFRLPKEDLALLVVVHLKTRMRQSVLLRRLVRRGCMEILKAQETGQEKKVK